MSYFAFAQDQPNGTKASPQNCMGSILNLNMNSLIQSVVTLRDTFVKNNDFCHVLLFIYAGDITHVLYF